MIFYKNLFGILAFWLIDIGMCIIILSIDGYYGIYFNESLIYFF